LIKNFLYFTGGWETRCIDRTYTITADFKWTLCNF